jgi:putative NADH-flavin reductase
MRLFVLGATGKTGRALVSQGIARGHRITAFSRSAGGSDANEMLSSVLGDPMLASELASALPGHGAVLSVLGSRGHGVRYSHHPGVSGAPGRKNDDDLHRLS